MADAWALRFHLGEASVRGRGTFEVTRGSTRRARLACVLLRAPRRGSAVPVRVEVLRHADGEVWTRVIGGRRYISRQVRSGTRVLERIGPLELDFAVTVDGNGLRYEQTRTALRLGRLRLPVPRWLCPSVRARVEARDDSSFFVRVDTCAFGPEPLFSYYGTVLEA
jgi:Domain of unknown function (DUF4166)